MAQVSRHEISYINEKVAACLAALVWCQNQGPDKTYPGNQLCSVEGDPRRRNPLALWKVIVS